MRLGQGFLGLLDPGPLVLDDALPLELQVALGLLVHGEQLARHAANLHAGPARWGRSGVEAELGGQVWGQAAAAGIAGGPTTTVALARVVLAAKSWPWLRHPCGVRWVVALCGFGVGVWRGVVGREWSEGEIGVW